MTRIFVELPSFRKEWKAMGLTDDDLRRLQEELLADPKVGKVMRETGGVRKMRFAFETQGKSGSVRVIYVDFEIYKKLYLLTAYPKNCLLYTYPKNEKDNLTRAERNTLKQLVGVLEQQLEKNSGKET